MADGRTIGEEVERGVMGVPANDQHQMDQGVGGQETGARHRRRPVARAPCPCGEREAGHEERHADVLDEMRIEWAGVGYARHVSYQNGPATSIASPLKKVGIARIAAIMTSHGSLLRPRRARRLRCDGTGQRNLRSHFGPNSPVMLVTRSGLNFALGKPDKTR